MPTATQLGGRTVSVIFGLLMVGLASFGAGGPALILAAAAVLAVGFATVFRAAATIAVLLTVAVMMVSEPSNVLAALSGLCAVAYLVCRHAADTGSGTAAENWPTIVAAVGFTFAGLVSTAFPLQLPWLPLAAPLAVLAIYVLATRPFFS